MRRIPAIWDAEGPKASQDDQPEAGPQVMSILLTESSWPCPGFQGQPPRLPGLHSLPGPGRGPGHPRPWPLAAGNLPGGSPPSPWTPPAFSWPAFLGKRRLLFLGHWLGVPPGQAGIAAFSLDAVWQLALMVLDPMVLAFGGLARLSSLISRPEAFFRGLGRRLGRQASAKAWRGRLPAPAMAAWTGRPWPGPPPANGAPGPAPFAGAPFPCAGPFRQAPGMPGHGHGVPGLPPEFRQGPGLSGAHGPRGAR